MTLQHWLDGKADLYNHSSFIASDPISVPHHFDLRQDIEIAGFFTSIMAWGQRPTIIRKANELMALMDRAPYQFITQHQEKDRNRFLVFKHRTLQPDDIIFLTDSLQRYYLRHETLEDAFAGNMSPTDENVYNGLQD